MDRQIAEVSWGYIPQLEDAPALELESFLLSAAALGDTTTAQPSVVFPQSADYISALPSWQVLGNDKAGVCNAVSWANQRRLVTSKLGDKELYPSQEDVYTFYKTQNPNFNPSGTEQTNGPESDADKGMRIQLGLEELTKNGGPDGNRPIAFARVNPKNLNSVRQAISIFGSLWIGFQTYTTTVQQWRSHEPFSVPRNGTIHGGHAVIVGGFTPSIQCVTWGTVHPFEDSYFTSGNVFEAWAVIWPEHLGTRSFMLNVNLAQLAVEYKRLTDRDLALPSAPFSSLYFVKTRNTQSGKIEVQLADQAFSYATWGDYKALPSGYQAADADNGVWDVDGKDLYFIKTKSTGTNTIEVHRTTNASKYATFDVHSGSGYGLGDAQNGTWTIDGGDLYFIKTKNTGSGKIEVHRTPRANYNKFDLHVATTMAQSESQNGTWRIYNKDLYFIKYRNTTSSNVELWSFPASKNYQQHFLSKTWFNVQDGDNGTWDIGANMDLYFIKHRNPGSKRVEVHVATSASKYGEVSHYATWINEKEGANGTWCVI